MRSHREFAGPLLLLVAACAAPAEQPSEPTSDEVAALCETQPCRQPGDFEIQFDGGRHIETIGNAQPYIQNDEISIKPGESLVIEGTVRDRRLASLRVQHGTPTAAPVLILEFEQNGSERTLTIKNSFDVAFKFHIDMRFAGKDAWYETSSCGLGPSPSADTPFYTNVELWSDPIAELILFDFRVVEPDEAFQCVY